MLRNNREQFITDFLSIAYIARNEHTYIKETLNRIIDLSNAAINLNIAASSAVKACGVEGSGIVHWTYTKPTTAKRELSSDCIGLCK